MVYCFREKVCVFFSLVLLNFYTATSGKCSLIRDFIPCLNLFAEHINEGTFETFIYVSVIVGFVASALVLVILLFGCFGFI